MQRLLKSLQKASRTIIGVNSGTSMDAVDVVLVRLAGSGQNASIELVDFRSYPFDDGLRTSLVNLAKATTPETHAKLHHATGLLFSSAIRSFMSETGHKQADIDCIGSHGQTVGHFPEASDVGPFRVRATLQLGDTSVIAVQTGITTIGDFRTADIAAGGSGAPLVPWFDFVFLRSAAATRAVLNIGGIANVTILPAGGDVHSVMAWDTGPGNMLLDAASRRFLDQPFDQDGIAARTGRVIQDILHELLDLDYFKQPPPKSTGREIFGEVLLEGLTERHPKTKPEDWLATLTEFTARSIAAEIGGRTNVKIDEVVVSGGGLQNKFLMERLKAALTDMRLSTTDEYGIPSRAKEAMLFSFLANECVMGSPANLPQVTGASKRVILGKICPEES